MQHPGAGWEAARLRGCEHLYEEDSAASPRGKRTGSTSVMIFSRGACVLFSCFSCPHCFRWGWGWGGQCDLDRINTTLQIFLLRASTPSLSEQINPHGEKIPPLHLVLILHVQCSDGWLLLVSEAPLGSSTPPSRSHRLSAGLMKMKHGVISASRG